MTCPTTAVRWSLAEFAARSQPSSSPLHASPSRLHESCSIILQLNTISTLRPSVASSLRACVKELIHPHAIRMPMHPFLYAFVYRCPYSCQYRCLYTRLNTDNSWWDDACGRGQDSHPARPREVCECMCAGMRADMCADMLADVCADVCADMCAGHKAIVEVVRTSALHNHV